MAFLLLLPRVQGSARRTHSESRWPGLEGHRAAGVAARARESALGPSADLRRAGQAWPRGVADERAPSPRSGAAGAGTAARGAELARVLARASRRHRGVRLLHR